MVLVARKGETLLAKGYGFADYKQRRNTPRTLFEIASTSKQFTAAAILKLRMMGKLKLTDTLGKFFNNVPQDKRTITVRHLLVLQDEIRQRWCLMVHLSLPAAKKLLGQLRNASD